MRWIRIEKAEPFSFKFKTTFLPEMPFGTICIKKKNGNGRTLESLANIQQNILYHRD